jgi:glutathione S-transferase
MDLVLYHAARTRSIRVRWALEEMELPYRLETVDWSQKPVGGDAYRAVHPLNKVPALRDGDTTVLESMAIVQYLATKYGPTAIDLRTDEPDYGRYLTWLHFGEAGMTMPVTLLLAHTALLPEDSRNPKLAAWAKGETEKLLDFLAEDGLAGRDWLAGGRFTTADISVVYMLFLLKMIGQFDDAPAAVKAYWTRATARSTWAKATAAED